MAQQLKETLKKNLHPYIFALKEGKKIRNDYLDYSLLMIHVQNNEVIRSPSHYDFLYIPQEKAVKPATDHDLLGFVSEPGPEPQALN